MVRKTISFDIAALFCTPIRWVKKRSNFKINGCSGQMESFSHCLGFNTLVNLCKKGEKSGLLPIMIWNNALLNILFMINLRIFFKNECFIHDQGFAGSIAGFCPLKVHFAWFSSCTHFLNLFLVFDMIAIFPIFGCITFWKWANLVGKWHSLQNFLEITWWNILEIENQSIKHLPLQIVQKMNVFHQSKANQEKTGFIPESVSKV